ncbi:hypothetical protein [Roseibium litorale]|uniref:Uncharacterized protein n=1 Tax=Roseibium litorale TaxID=2803841 RepID=A0ABR9CL69_9HYPH|nr:hypothetical protein [Roseibium litorale]MBD8891072.1 hypothetical protein [Roseibium litorale]
MTRKMDLAGAMFFTGAILCLLVVFFSNAAFFAWAFERHQNTASWVARPLLVIPFCFFAWKRSLAGIMASVLAILSSMFWFPVPAEPRPDVLRFLAMERELLSSGWSLENIWGAVAVVLYCAALAAAFWKHSWKLGLIAAAAGAALKSVWSVAFSPEAGAAVFPFAFGGLLLLVLLVFALRRHLR